VEWEKLCAVEEDLGVDCVVILYIRGVQTVLMEHHIVDRDVELAF